MLSGFQRYIRPGRPFVLPDPFGASFANVADTIQQVQRLAEEGEAADCFKGYAISQYIFSASFHHLRVVCVLFMRMLW